jgi:glycosyltransferase involved in cell wall biosynthesis
MGEQRPQSAVQHRETRNVAERAQSRPLVSLILPAFNEEAILEPNLAKIFKYLDDNSSHYRWEVILVNDGSRDRTGEIAERIAATRSDFIVLHHPRNFGLGQALKFGFAHSAGDYVVSIDVDLSYSTAHIGLLLDAIRATRAKIVLASPYMKGGTIGNVPRLRRILSIWANRFLSVLAHGRLSTLTCLVRAYDGPFIRSLNLRAMGMEVMPEMIYKSMVLRATIDQVPATLDWELQAGPGAARKSSMRILQQVFRTLLSGFVFRPFAFFILPGLLLFAFSLYVNIWMLIHFFEALVALPPEVTGRASVAVANAYRDFPHTFIVGLFSLTVSVQLISLGVIALQNKNYFEEMFHLVSSVKRNTEALRSGDCES